MKTKEVRGITIISLVVTIVVLLILAGVSINVTLGDNGIIKKVQNSANLTRESEAKEIIQRIVMEFYLTNDYETLKDFLNDKVLKGKIDKVEENTDGTLNVWKDNYSVTVDNKTNSSSSNGNGNDNSKSIKIDAIPYEGKYDGNEHEAISSVNVEPKDAKIEYSTDGTNYSTTIPTIMNVGTVLITIRASKENYEMKNMTVIAKIEKAEGKLAFNETLIYPNSTSFTVSGNVGILSVESSNTDVATVSISENTVTVKSIGAGSATITIESAESIGYNAEKVTYTVTVEDNTFKEESGVGYYADTDGDGTPDGIIFEDFKKGGSGSWAGQSYSVSSSTSLKDYYISQKNYEGTFGTRDVLSSIGSGNGRFYVMALNDYRSYTYKYTECRDIRLKEWHVPTKNEFAAFGNELNITTSNYSEYGLKGLYWSSTTYNQGSRGYAVSFSSCAISAESNNAIPGYVRLCRIF